MLRQRRANYQAEATLLKQWHQIYHWFRMSAHCLVSGLDHLCQHQFEESLDMFTEAYNYTARLHEYQLQGQTSSPSRGLRTAHLLRLLCLTLPEVNHCLIKRFRLHENDDKELIEVTKNIRQLVVPVLILLQNRISQATITNTASPQNQGAAQAARTLEDVRSDWCALLGKKKLCIKCSNIVNLIKFYFLGSLITCFTAHYIFEQTFAIIYDAMLSRIIVIIGNCIYWVKES